MKHTFSYLLLVATALATSVDPDLGTIELTEEFGVSHTRQILRAPLPDACRDRVFSVVDDDGEVVAHQVLADGRLALLTGLPAASSRRWHLRPEPRPLPATDLIITEGPDYIELRNRLTGIRLPQPAADLRRTPCPIQGLRLRDGRWTAAGPNLMSRPALAMDLQWLARGPLVASLRLTYRYDRAALSAAYEPADIPAGVGSYSCTVEMQAEQPSILFEEYSEVDLHWSVDVDPGLHPDRAQYRGHHATSIAEGRHGDGSQYGTIDTGAGVNFRGSMDRDAVVDLDYGSGRIDPYSRGRYKFLSHWDPWAVNTGHYWQVFSATGDNDNLLGLFAGPSSRLGGTGVSGVAFDTQPDGVTDLDSELAADGTIHVVYRHGRELIYRRLSAALEAGPPVRLGADLSRPDLQLDDGEIRIVVCDELSQSLCLLVDRGNGFERQPVRLQPGLTVVWPEAWQAVAGDRELLLLYGTAADDVQGLLLQRAADDDSFALLDTLPAPPNSPLLGAPGFQAQRSKPSIVGLPDGSARILYTAANGTAVLSELAAGQRQLRRSSQLTAGANAGGALDATGAVYVGAGTIRYRTAAGETLDSGISCPMDPGDAGANRRSLAVDAAGNVLLVHSARLWRNYPQFRQLTSYLYAKDRGGWHELTPAPALARVHYQPASDRFVVLGRNDRGCLAIFAWKPDAPELQPLTELEDTARHYTGVRVRFQRLMPTQYYAPQIRFSWGLFAGQRSQDLRPPDDEQEVGHQMNLHAGVNLTKLLPLRGDYPDPPQGYGNLYVPDRVWRSLAAQLQAEQARGERTLFDELIRDSPPLTPLFEYWREPSLARLELVYGPVIAAATDFVETLANREGIYRQSSTYFMGALRFSGYFVAIDQALAANELPGVERQRLKLALLLIGSLLWDHDLAPMQPGTNINLGPHNMASMWLGMRYVYTLLLAGHPDFAARAAAVASLARDQWQRYVNVHGAPDASTHYTAASIVPLLNLSQQLQQSGLADLFSDEPRVRKFARFYMQQVTPPEVRFGGRRKLVAVGDGSTEASVMHGQLGTGFAAGLPALSRELMWIWDSMGRMQDQFFGASLLKIDGELPVTAPVLTSEHFPGWCSVLRCAWQTPDETAIWFVNGDQLTDHRHDDMGSVVIYALGVPISLDWGPIYYPRAAGGLMHSSVSAESRMSHRWDLATIDLNSPPAGGTANWWETHDDRVISFAHSSEAMASFRLRQQSVTVFKRRVRLIHLDPARPVIVIDDDIFQSDDDPEAMIWSMNFAATGDIDSPFGPLTPELRFYDWRAGKDRQQLPSSSPARPLAAGAHRFGFHGQWGVDWDLFVQMQQPQELTFGNWGHNWHPSREVAEFRRAHGRDFEERQHILRLRGRDRFRALILPHRAGTEALRAQRDGDAWIITGADLSLRVTADQLAGSCGPSRVLASYTSAPAADGAATINGGPAELVFDGGGGTLTVSGAGERRVVLPAGWRCPDCEPVAGSDALIARPEGESSRVYALTREDDRE